MIIPMGENNHLAGSINDGGARSSDCPPSLHCASCLRHAVPLIVAFAKSGGQARDDIQENSNSSYRVL